MEKFYKYIFFVCIAIFSGCSSNRDSVRTKIVIPDPARIVVSTNKVELSEGDVAALRMHFEGLKPTKRAISAVANAHLLVYSKDQITPNPVAVFLQDGVVYEGYFQDAWTERMEGKKSECYELNRPTKALLEKLLIRP